MEPAAKSGKGTGTVTAIDAAAGTVTIEHGAHARDRLAGDDDAAFTADASRCSRESRRGDKVALHTLTLRPRSLTALSRPVAPAGRAGASSTVLKSTAPAAALTIRVRRPPPTDRDFSARGESRIRR